MTRALLILAAIAAMLLGGGAALLRSCAVQARWDRDRFENECARAFRASRGPEEVQQRFPTLPFAVVRFPDGSWTVACVHSSHEDAPFLNEWDSAVVADSRGSVYRTRRHICGQEGLDADFRMLPRADLPGYWARAVPALDLTPIPSPR